MKQGREREEQGVDPDATDLIPSFARFPVPFVSLGLYQLHGWRRFKETHCEVGCLQRSKGK